MPQFLSLPGGSGNHASMPDDAALDITADLDLRVLTTMSDWTPAVQQAFVGKWHATNPDRSWVFSCRPSGTLRFEYESSGYKAEESTVAPGFTNGTRHGIRVTVDADNGAAGHDITFYTSADYGASWDQLGDVVTVAGTATMTNSSRDVYFGSHIGTGQLLIGNMDVVEIYDGIGGTRIARADFTCSGPARKGAASFVDPVSGLTVSINGTAALVGSCVPELADSVPVNFSTPTVNDELALLNSELIRV